MAVFPNSLPAAGSAVSNDTLAAAGHTALHNLVSDEIRAVATKIGTGSSTPTSGMVLRGTGAGTSAWGQVVLTTDVSGILPIANGGTGTTSVTGSGSVVYDTNPTIVGPTIADFTNATHNHQSNSGGGKLAGAALNDQIITPDKLALGLDRALVATNETTASTSYTNLATTGPAISVTVGVNGILLINISSFIGNTTIDQTTYVSFALSGANTQAADDSFAIALQPYAGNAGGILSGAFLITGLTAGSTTVTLKYRCDGGTGRFINRRVGAIPL